MLTIEKTTDHNVIEEIVCDRRLWDLLDGQSENADRAHYKPDMQYDYLVVRDGQHLVGLFNIRNITAMSVEVHIRILPSYWGSEMAIKASQIGFEWVINNTQARNAVAFVPIPCKHVLKLSGKIGFTVCGLIKNGIVWDKQLVDLLILSKTLREE